MPSSLSAEILESHELTKLFNLQTKFEDIRVANLVFAGSRLLCCTGCMINCT